MREPLHFNQTAPLNLPLPLMLAAPAFGFVAIALVLAGSPDILSSRWNTSLIAAVHLFTLGFLGCTMFAAILQILPVLSGRPPLRNRFMIRSLQAGLLAGNLLFGWGMLAGHAGMMRVAAVLLGIAIVLLFASALPQSGLFTRQKGTPGGRPALSGMLIALAGFAIAATLGLRLLAGWGFDAFHLPRQLTDIHAGWAMLGWVAPLIFAVSREVIPMFQFTRELPRLFTWLPGLLFMAMLLASFPQSRTAGLLVLAACLVTGAITVLERQWRRPHGNADATFLLFRIAMLSLIAAIGVFFLPDSLFATGDARKIVFTMLFLAGFAGSCVMGMLLKIVPFLVRLHLQRELWHAGVPARTLPGFTRMVPAFTERWLWPAQASGVVLCMAGIWFNWLPAILAGFSALGMAMLMCAYATWEIALQGRRVRRELHVHADESGVALK